MNTITRRQALLAGLGLAGCGSSDDSSTPSASTGSGTTPWSRMGDGRLTLKGGVREVLATAMLEALGVDTSGMTTPRAADAAVEAAINAAFDDPAVRYLTIQADHHAHFRVADYAPWVRSALALRAA